MTTRNTIRQSTVRGSVRDTIRMDAANDPLAFHALSYNPLTYEIKNVLKGTGDLTEARTGSVYQPDHEGIWREFATAVPAYKGGRVVENLAVASDDLTNLLWTTNGGATKDSSDTITFTAAHDSVGQNVTPENGTANASFIVSAVVWVDSGTELFRLKNTHSAVLDNFSADLTATTTKQRFSFAVTNGSAAGNGLQTIGIQNSSTPTAKTLHVENLQIEESTGRTDTTTPSEYIPTTTAALQKVFANENGNTVAANVVTEAVGAALASPPWLYGAPAATNLQIYSKDLTNAEWTATNMTVAFTADGMTGAANDASELTATAANATVMANQIVAASADQTTRWFLKRKTGTGAIEITVDNGTTWQDVTTEVDSTAGFNEAIESLAATTNIQIGIRVVVSGDAVYVGNAEGYTAKTESQIRQSSPIFTSGATASVNATSLSFDSANHNIEVAAWFLEFMAGSDFDQRVSTPGIVTNGAANFFYLVSNGTFNSRTNVNATASYNYVANEAIKLGFIYDTSADKRRVNAENSWGIEVVFGSAWTSSVIDVFRSGQITTPLFMRNLRRYDLTYAAAKAKIDELMA